MYAQSLKKTNNHAVLPECHALKGECRNSVATLDHLLNAATTELSPNFCLFNLQATRQGLSALAGRPLCAAPVRVRHSSNNNRRVCRIATPTSPPATTATNTATTSTQRQQQQPPSVRENASDSPKPAGSKEPAQQQGHYQWTKQVCFFSAMTDGSQRNSNHSTHSVPCLPACLLHCSGTLWLWKLPSTPLCLTR